MAILDRLHSGGHFFKAERVFCRCSGSVLQNRSLPVI